MKGGSSWKEKIELLLPRVSKPARYVNNEWNAIHKDWERTRARVVLGYPDVYEVGMSHLGTRILYDLVNSRPDALAERVFAPWPDMERELRQSGIPLVALESWKSVAEFDLVGFTLQYELTFTNLLNMLDLAGIPVSAQERRRAEGRLPVVIAGGPCAFNPEPLAPFIDLFVIGDGEEALNELIDELIRVKDRDEVALSRRQRAEFLEAASRIPGVHVPLLFKPGQRILKRVVKRLDEANFPVRPIVPCLATVHDRAVLELFRGCTRGCRFCQAGMIYRPVRERGPETLKHQAHEILSSTGYEELGLMSLSSSDYTCIEELLAQLIREYGEDAVALSLPSMRVDSFSVRLCDQIRRSRRTGLTFAPEAGTQRLRNVINKRVTERDLLEAVEAAARSGWHSLKLYFMIGLPTERMEDVAEIPELCKKVLRAARLAAHDGDSRSGEPPGQSKQFELSVSVANFVPKPHTPFQWDPQLDMESLKARQREIAKGLAPLRRIKYEFHDVRMSWLEALIARGDRRVAELILSAWRRGCRFDGWQEELRYEEWLEAVKETGIDPAHYINRERDYDETLPWDHIDSGVSKKFLIAERERAFRGETTPDCREQPCSGCGVCPRLGVENILNQVKEAVGVGAGELHQA